VGVLSSLRVVLYGQPAKGRKQRNRNGRPARAKTSLQCAAREREPWLLVASPALQDLSAQQLVTLYKRRMQIEESFRDLKSHRYGQGFEDSLTHKGARIEVLLLINAMAMFASWIVGMTCEATGLDRWLSPRRSMRRLYSILRLGREALVRRWPIGSILQLIGRLRHPSAELLAQLGVPA
jgi:Transposase DDE domain